MGRTGTLAKDKEKKRGIEVDVRNRHPRIRKKKTRSRRADARDGMILSFWGGCGIVDGAWMAEACGMD